jgi:hypothetical protein
MNPERAARRSAATPRDPKATKIANAGALGITWSVEPGTRLLESKLAGSDARVGTFHVQVRADSLTQLTMTATPEGN